MAEDPSLPGPPSTIRLGCQVIDIEPVQGVITLKDGTKIQKDLIIVADGQHDRLNKEVTGREIPMQRSGQTAYRCLIPMKDVLADPVTAPLFATEGPGFWAPALPQKGVMCVTYPCRNNEILNCLIVARKLNATHKTSEEDQAIEDWNFPATPEMLEAVMDGFHPSVKALMMKSPEIKMYTQMKRDPLPKLFKGKTILIGDACHPMLLTHAQGVSSSIEDAAALEVFLRGVVGSGNVSSAPSRRLTERLAMFEGFRLPRVSATQILTEPIVPGPNFIKMGQAAEQRIRQYYQGPLPPMTSVPHSVPICNFFFAYDVTWEAEQALDLANRMLQLTLLDKKPVEEVKPVIKVTQAEIPSIVTPPDSPSSKDMHSPPQQTLQAKPQMRRLRSWISVNDLRSKFSSAWVGSR